MPPRSHAALRPSPSHACRHPPPARPRLPPPAAPPLPTHAAARAPHASAGARPAALLPPLPPQARQRQLEKSHQLEVARLRKEAEYHKRLRQGAEQRALQLEGQLKQQQRQAQGFDEAQSGLIEQSQVRVGTL